MKDLQIKQLIFLPFCLKLLSQMKPTKNWLRIRYFLLNSNLDRKLPVDDMQEASVVTANQIAATADDLG